MKFIGKWLAVRKSCGVSTVGRIKSLKVSVRQKKFSIWNEVMERAGADFEGSRKAFWALVSKRLKKNISSLRNDGIISVISTRGKIFTKSFMSIWVR